MKKTPLIIPFCLALFAALFATVFFPHSRILSFAPFLAIVYMRKNFATSLWIAALCGLILDLLSSQLRFGLYSLNFCLTTLLVYHQKRHFFDDKPLALSLFTALISCISSAVLLFLVCIFDKTFPFNWTLIVSDLIGMSIIDAIYAFFWFTCLIKLYYQVRERGWRIFLFKKSQE